MAQSVPASKFVNIVPGVIGTGGNPLALNSVMLTDDTAIPIGTVQSFSSAADVSDFFGGTSTEYDLASTYFSGFENSTSKPGALHVAQFNTAAVAAYLRGGSVAGMTLAQLQALSGVLTIIMDGDALTSSTITLTSATSFSAAAALIEAGFTSGPDCMYDSQRGAFVLTSPTTGAESTITFATGTLSAGLKLTAATGAVTSQGADAATPAEFMEALVDLTQNWASLFTTWEPADADKTLFADWFTGSGQRYLYIPWDSSTVPATTSPASSCFAQLMIAGEYDGVYPAWPDATEAAFIAGLVASIDFTRENGRIDPFFKAQSGGVATVTDSPTFDNLTANGYNFRVAVAPANDRFVVHAHGKMPGKWEWLDPYINQIYMNSQFQLAFLTLLMSANSIPHNEFGRELIRAAAQDPINEALFNGTIRTGIDLSNQQKALINQQAGQDISQQLYATGYYLQVLPATAQQRGLRRSGPVSFWYTDGGGVHYINMPSIDIQ